MATQQDELQSVEKLIERLQTGDYENIEETITKLSDAIRREDESGILTAQLLNDDSIPIRKAALLSCTHRNEPFVLSELRKLVMDPSSEIREALAVACANLPESESYSLLQVLAREEKRDVRLAAINATFGKATMYDLMSDRLGYDEDFDVRISAAKAMGTLRTHSITRRLNFAFMKDGHTAVRKTCAQLIEERLDFDSANQEYIPSEAAVVEEAHRMLKTYGLHKFPKFAAALEAKRTSDVNVDELEDYGTDLTLLAQKGKLPRGFFVEKYVADAMKYIRAEDRRSLALLGEPGVGKSAVINEIVYELAKPENGEWHVLRISPNEFLVGTKYIGEWNTKLAEIVNLARQPRRVILYIPNFSELSGIGRYHKSETNVASALSTYIEDGSILLIGESTSKEYAEQLGSIPSLDRLFAKIQIEESKPEITRKIMTAVRDKECPQLTDAMLDEIVELGEQFLHHVQAPGNCVSLLRDLIAKETDKTKPINRRTVLDTISGSTGIPSDFLDDSIPLDLLATRKFLEERVMGQPVAVEAVLDLISAIKAGLTDSKKPFGIYFFCGPTGVGKTEMAKTLAEFVFGSPERLVRIDMSEFASWDSFERLIGAGRFKGILTEAVRQRPFSVVLLDEIEKAHPNVFDLCLQIFDAGRLTDGHGRTIDFRSSILIMTSNVGFSKSGTIGGFQPAATVQSAADLNKSGIVSSAENDRIFKELSRVFRPEFMNRIDRIINFRQLERDTAEQIARREVNAVLKRTGIGRRNLSIAIDPTVITLLVKEGYSASFGARPLKRAIEQLFVQPLARIIASGQVTADSKIMVTADDTGAISVKTASTPAKPRAQSRSRQPRTE